MARLRHEGPVDGLITDRVAERHPAGTGRSADPSQKRLRSTTPSPSFRKTWTIGVRRTRRVSSPAQPQTIVPTRGSSRASVGEADLRWGARTRSERVTPCPRRRPRRGGAPCPRTDFAPEFARRVSSVLDSCAAGCQTRYRSGSRRVPVEPPVHHLRRHLRHRGAAGDVGSASTESIGPALTAASTSGAGGDSGRSSSSVRSGAPIRREPMESGRLRFAADGPALRLHRPRRHPAGPLRIALPRRRGQLLDAPGPGPGGVSPRRGRGGDQVRPPPAPGAGGRAADGPDRVHLRGRLRGDDGRRGHGPDRRLPRRRGSERLRDDRRPRRARTALRVLRSGARVPRALAHRTRALPPLPRQDRRRRGERDPRARGPRA